MPTHQPSRIAMGPILFLHALAVLVALGSCNSSSTNGAPADGAAAVMDLARAPADLSAQPTPDLAPAPDLTITGGDDGGVPVDCHPVATSNLKGVSLRYAGKTCTFTLAQAAAGVSFPYVLEVAADVPLVVPAPGGNPCQLPGASGIIAFETIFGGESSYCICDVGRCVPPTFVPMTVKKGSYPGAMAWDGRNWSGPSDFNQPKGPAFPKGVYDFVVTAVGQAAGAAFEVKLVVPITLR